MLIFIPLINNAGVVLQEFFSAVEGKFKTATVQAWYTELVARRSAAHAQKEAPKQQ